MSSLECFCVRTFGSGVGLPYSIYLLWSMFVLVLSYAYEQVVYLRTVLSSRSWSSGKASKHSSRSWSSDLFFFFLEVHILWVSQVKTKMICLYRKARMPSWSRKSSCSAVVLRLLFSLWPDLKWIRHQQWRWLNSLEANFRKTILWNFN